jgi:hypothetical protein
MWRRVARGLVLSGLFALLSSSALFAQTHPFVGFIEKPAAGETVSGMVLVQGYALDQERISRIDLYVDGAFQHSANIDIPRIDVIEAYRDWAGIQTRQPGFTTGFQAGRFSNGSHEIHVVVTTDDNRTFEVGRRTILVDNSINQAPFGSVDIPDTSGIFDTNGSFPVVGWAADTDGVARVDVLIDNLNTQTAMYGDPRPDVGNAFPDFPAAVFSGFIANVDTTRVQDGVHTLTVRVTDRQGLARVIGRRDVQIFNSENNLRPFGYIDEPKRDTVLYGTNCATVPTCRVSPCVPADFENHITPVRGWALDLGTRADLGRISYAELMVDGARWYSTNSCTFDSTLGAFVNCYGLPRFDVQRYYPTYPDAPRSGFMFTLDVGALMAIGVPAGHHVLKVRVGDQEQTFADLPNTSGIPVFFQCADQTTDFASQGYIDFPKDHDFVKGDVTFSGWALDDNGGVQQVEVLVDGNLLGIASYGYARPDVRAAYPTSLNSGNSGWRFTMDTTQLGDNRHRLTVQVLDRQGHRSIIGSVDFYVDNPN